MRCRDGTGPDFRHPTWQITLLLNQPVDWRKLSALDRMIYQQKLQHSDQILQCQTGTRAQQQLRCPIVATIDISQKEGADVPLLWGAAQSPSNTMWPGPRSTSVLSEVFIHQPLGHNRHRQKTGGLYPFQGGAATPSITTSPGLRFTSVPSGILIHPAVWP